MVFPIYHPIYHSICTEAIQSMQFGHQMPLHPLGHGKSFLTQVTLHFSLALMKELGMYLFGCIPQSPSLFHPLSMLNLQMIKQFVLALEGQITLRLRTSPLPALKIPIIPLFYPMCPPFVCSQTGSILVAENTVLKIAPKLMTLRLGHPLKKFTCLTPLWSFDSASTILLLISSTIHLQDLVSYLNPHHLVLLP